MSDTGRPWRAALIAQWGQPVQVDAATALALAGITDVPPGDVIAFRYRDAAAAQAWARSNAEHEGHPRLGICPTPDGPVGVYDLRPALARAKAERRASG